MKRIRRQLTCQCSAYSFPHRFGGGSCNGLSVVEKTWSEQSFCKNCHLKNYGCEVLRGIESPKECEGVIEIIHLYEVKLK